MGDYVSTRIEIGGKMTKKIWDEINKLGEIWFHGDKYDWAEDETLIFEGERNYGNADETTEYCRAHNLPYELEWGEGGGFGSGVEYWQPGMENPKTLDRSHEGDVFITIDELEKMAAGGNTIYDAIALLKLPPVPPAEICEGE